MALCRNRSLDSQAKRLTLIKSGADVRHLPSALYHTIPPPLLARRLLSSLCVDTSQNIPKRRYGEQELELALLPFLDETVRYEARLALAMEGT